MIDEKDKGEDKGEGQSTALAKDSRRDRLKLALRENLKRRKVQAKQRSGLAAASSEDEDASPHDFSGKKPGK